MRVRFLRGTRARPQPPVEVSEGVAIEEFLTESDNPIRQAVIPLDNAALALSGLLRAGAWGRQRVPMKRPWVLMERPHYRPPLWSPRLNRNGSVHYRPPPWGLGLLIHPLSLAHSLEVHLLLLHPALAKARR